MYTLNVLTNNCIFYIDNAMYAVKCSDNTWRRGVVINIQEGSGTTIYTVQCIDYGFLEILTASRYLYSDLH